MGQQRVLDVGNCDLDHGAIRRMLTGAFDVDVERVMFVADALAASRARPFDLILVNRLIFADGSPGIELVRQLQGDPALRPTPVMLISNYADAQATAVAAGARPGFGKAALAAPETLERLREFLTPRADARAAGV